MAAHVGCYNDAINVKRNEMWLVIHNLLGGINSAGAKLFNLYRRRAKRGTDRTDYVGSRMPERTTNRHLPRTGRSCYPPP